MDECKAQDDNNTELKLSEDDKDKDQMECLPLMKSGYSIEADMKFGWKP